MAIKVCTQAMLARLYLGFLGTKQLGVLLSPLPHPQWDARPSQDYPPSTSSGNLDILPVPIYTPGWREAL